MKIPNAIIKRVDDLTLEVKVEKSFREGLQSVLASSPSGYFFIEIKRPFRPRTTGRRSQCNRFRGGCRDIAEQLGYEPEQIADALKRMAVEEGYPTRYAIDGAKIPISEAACSVEEESLLIKVMNRFADQYSLYLTEYGDDGVPYRTVGGRTRKEMEGYDG